MKRSEMVLRISNKLQKQEHMLRSDMDLKQLCDNLALRVMTEIESSGMLPPPIKGRVNTPMYEGDEDTWIGYHDEYTPIYALQWEPEDE